MLCGYIYYGTFPTSTNHIVTSSVEFYHPCHISSHIWEKEGLHQWAIYRSTSRHVDSPVFDFRITLLYMSLDFRTGFRLYFQLAFILPTTFAGHRCTPARSWSGGVYAAQPSPLIFASVKWFSVITESYWWKLSSCIFYPNSLRVYVSLGGLALRGLRLLLCNLFWISRPPQHDGLALWVLMLAFWLPIPLIRIDIPCPWCCVQRHSLLALAARDESGNWSVLPFPAICVTPSRI